MLELEKILPAKKSSTRQLKVAQTIKELVAEAIVHKQVEAEVLENNFITISKVNISPDLQNATVFITVYNCLDSKSFLAELNKLAPKFRYIVNKNLQLKFSPQITFRYDDTLENVDRINSLLSSLDR